MGAEHSKDTYLSDIPKDLPIFGKEYMNKYLNDLEERSTISYDYASAEQQILARRLMNSFEVRQPSPPTECG